MTTFEKFLADWHERNARLMTAHTAKKFIDGIETPQGLASEAIDALQKIIMCPDVVTITDSNGNALTAIKLFSERLTDGSVLQTAELTFEQPQPDTIPEKPMHTLADGTGNTIRREPLTEDYAASLNSYLSKNRSSYRWTKESQ